MSGRWWRRARLIGSVAGCVLAAAICVPTATVATPPTTASPPQSDSASVRYAPPGGRIPYDNILAWFALLHRAKVDGWNDTLGIFIDGFDPTLNVATAFINISGLPADAFPRDEVIDLRDLRKSRPDLARQFGKPSSVTRVWAVSRFSFDRAALTQLRDLLGKAGKRFPRNFFHSEPALVQAVKAAEDRLKQQGVLGKNDSLIRRLLDIFSERDFCARCDPFVRNILQQAGVLNQVDIHSMVAYGEARGDAGQSVTEEMESLLNEYGGEVLEALINNTSGGPALPPSRGTGGQSSGGSSPTDPSSGPSGQALTVDDLADLLSQLDSEDLGGIDFTSMQLRYLSESPSDDASDVAYAFRADDPTAGSGGTVVDGLRNAVQASDAFFVWLALPPSTFWVNLNPDEPNRIVADALGRTEVGRVLLEADRQLKQIDTALVNPHTDLGARFWNHQQPAPDGSYCFTYRLWIVPDTAKVRETDDAIYIVDAPLDVNMRPMDIDNGGCGHQPPAVKQHNAALYRRLILPRVVHAVNEAPEYAALRRVYVSRIAAEWYRQHSTIEPMAYSDLIDSGNIGRWQLRGSWTPRQTYRGFVKQWRSGKFDYRIRERHGNVITIKTYRTGGVDFTNLLKQNLTADAFASLAPGLAQTVEQGLQGAAVDPRTKARWLGGTSQVEVTDDESPPPVDADDSTSASVAPDDPWSRDYAPILVPLMILVGVGLVAVAVLRERRRHSGMRSWR
jgi:hypothetical protein